MKTPFIRTVLLLCLLLSCLKVARFLHEHPRDAWSAIKLQWGMPVGVEEPAEDPVVKFNVDRETNLFRYEDDGYYIDVSMDGTTVLMFEEPVLQLCITNATYITLPNGTIALFPTDEEFRALWEAFPEGRSSQTSTICIYK